jgi:hypothetical protein
MNSNEQLNWNDGSFHNKVPGSELSGRRHTCSVATTEEQALSKRG